MSPSVRQTPFLHRGLGDDLGALEGASCLKLVSLSK
jgi:hypothetical protein